MKFYKGTTEEGNTYRIVKDLGNDWFSVVKLVKPGVYTLKLWKGNLEKTSKFWSTKEFIPSQDEKRKLTKAYNAVVNKMRPKFIKL